MSSIDVPLSPFRDIGPHSINNPNIKALSRRFHPTDWPTSIIRKLFDIPHPLPTGEPLPCGTVPPDNDGPKDDRRAENSRYFRETLTAYYESDRSRDLFVTALRAFVFWLNELRRPFNHILKGVSFDIFDKNHIFRTPLTLSHMQRPFLTFIDERARLEYMTMPLVGKWKRLRSKETEYGLCAHDFAVLLAMAQIQRFRFDVKRDTYKVHIMYISNQGSPADTAIIVTAIIPGLFLDGLKRDPPIVNLDGLKFTRNTVELPQPNQKPQDCVLFKALMFIIDEHFKLLDPYIPEPFCVGEKYAYIYDCSSPSR